MLSTLTCLQTTTSTRKQAWLSLMTPAVSWAWPCLTKRKTSQFWVYFSANSERISVRTKCWNACQSSGQRSQNQSRGLRASSTIFQTEQSSNRRFLSSKSSSSAIGPSKSTSRRTHRRRRFWLTISRRRILGTIGICSALLTWCLPTSYLRRW